VYLDGNLMIIGVDVKVDVLVGSGSELELELELVRGNGKRADLAKPAMRPSASLT
jgi:hypothetical protein